MNIFRLHFISLISVIFGISLGLIGCADVNQLDDEVPEIDHKIIGGVVENAEPQAVVLRLGQSGLCTGTIIAPKLVLTAAHCITAQQGNSLVPVAVRDVSVVTNGRLQEQSRTLGDARTWVCWAVAAKVSGEIQSRPRSSSCCTPLTLVPCAA